MTVLAIKTMAAENFRSAFSTNSLYAFFGRKTAWSNDSIAPVVEDTIAFEETTRTNLLGIKKVALSDTCHVVPRIDWQEGIVYSIGSYVLTDQYNVYIVIDNNGGQISHVKPTGTSTSNFETGAGYTWKFLYNISPGMVSKFLTSDWLPVPTGDQRTAYQIAVEDTSSWSSGEMAEGNGSSAIYRMNASNVMIKSSFIGNENSFETNISFRQVGIILNPKLANGTIATASGYNLDGTSTINKFSGRIIHIQNTTPINRSVSQTENIQVIITL